MQGGDKLIIEKGTYTLTNNLYIPSNMMSELENGTVLKKITEKESEWLKSSSFFNSFSATE